MAKTDSEQLPDLVRDTELETSFRDELTIHTYKEAAHRAAIPRIEAWKRVRVLGFGGNGRVWLEECIQGQKVGRPSLRATKEIPLGHRSHAVDYRRELDALAKFSQEKFVTYFARSFGWFRGENTIYLALEYFELGDLQGYLSRDHQLYETDIQEVVFQILTALKYMHNEGFAHRDLKPANVLIRSKPPNNWWIKLTDFGLTKRITAVAGLSSQLGTQGYAAPEILWPFIVTGHNLEELPQAAVLSTDVWSLGEIAFRMWTGGQASFRTESQLLDYSKGLCQFPETLLRSSNASSLAKSFIKSVMDIPYSSRLTVPSALGHEWMTTQGPFTSTIEPSPNKNDLVSQLTRTTIETDTPSRGWTTPPDSFGPTDIQSRPIPRKPLPSTANLIDNASKGFSTTLVTRITDRDSARISAYVKTPVSFENNRSSFSSDSPHIVSTVPFENDDYMSANPVRTSLDTPLPESTALDNAKSGELTSSAVQGDGERLNDQDIDHERTQELEVTRNGTWVPPSKPILLNPIPQQQLLPLSGAQRFYLVSNLLNDEPRSPVLSISQPSTIWQMAISPNATYLATISDHGLQVFNLETRNSFHLLQEKQQVLSRWACIAFSPNSNWIATASYTNNIFVWKLPHPSSLRVLKGHLTKVRSIAFSPDSRSIVSTSDDRQLIRTLGGHIMDSFHFRRSLIFSCFLGSRTKILGISLHGKAYVWSYDDNTWKVVHKQDIGISSVSAASLSPNLNYIAAASGKELAFCSLDKSVNTAIYQFEDGIDSVAFDSKSTLIALTLKNKTLRIFSPIHSTFDALDWDIQLPWSATSYTSVSFSKERDLIVVATSDTTADLLDLSKLLADMYIRCYMKKLEQLSNSALAGQLNVHQKPYISADGLKAMSWYNHPPFILDDSLKYMANVLVWDVQTADILLFEALDGQYASSAFSSDSQRIAIVLRDNTVQIWHYTSHTCELHVRLADSNATISSPIFSQDMACMAFTRTNAKPPEGNQKPHSFLCLFRLGIPCASNEIELGNDDLQSMAFAADGSMLALLTNTEQSRVDEFSVRYNPGALRLRIFCLTSLQITLWKVIDVFRGIDLKSFILGTSFVSGLKQKVMFSPDGLRVAILSTTNEMEIWDIATCSLVQHHQWTRSSTAAIREPVLSPNWEYLAVHIESEIVILETCSMKRLASHVHSEPGRTGRFTEDSQFILLEHGPSETWFSVPDLEPLMTGDNASTGYISDLKAFITTKETLFRYGPKMDRILFTSIPCLSATRDGYLLGPYHHCESYWIFRTTLSILLSVACFV